MLPCLTDPAHARDKNVDELLKDLRDQGVIGEKKTRVVKPLSGVVFFRANESLVTPVMVEDEALFGSEFGGTFRLGYAFRFSCLDWKYNIKAYLTSRDPEGHTGSVVDLESPDKKTRIHVKMQDVVLSAGFQHPLTEKQIQLQGEAQERLDREYKKTEAIGIVVRSRWVAPYPDTLNREERIAAGKEAIGRWLDQGIDGYKMADGAEAKFSADKIAYKEFVRAEADLNSGIRKKKCVMWALDVSGYRLKSAPDERRANLWVCQVISDPADFPAIEATAHRIIETLQFAADDQNVYPDLRE